MGSKSKHTPGPWAFVSTDSGVRVFANDGTIAIIGLAGCHDEQATNAALIAAAPELLAALVELENLVANEYALSFLDTPKLFRARAAIARAKGQKEVVNE